MDDSEYKSLLEKLLEELTKALETCAYCAKRRRKILISERLEAARTAGYLVSVIEPLSRQLEQEKAKLAAEEESRTTQKKHNYVIFEILEKDGLIEIKDQVRLKKMFGITEETKENNQ